jgi:arginine repressor
MAKTETKSFAKKVSEKLSSEQRTNRWLISKLKEIGVDMTDTQLSNRLKEINHFKEEEIAAISKIFGFKE